MSLTNSHSYTPFSKKSSLPHQSKFEHLNINQAVLNWPRGGSTRIGASQADLHVRDQLVTDTSTVAIRRNHSLSLQRSHFPHQSHTTNYSTWQLYMVSQYHTTYTIRNRSTILSYCSLLYSYYAYQWCHPKQIYCTCFCHPSTGHWILQ